jgi:hypothetical protein
MQSEVTKMTKHTPTPWFQEKDAIYAKSQVDDEGHWYVANTITMPEDGVEMANAAFIVRAVNAHDDLVRAVQAFLVAVDTNASQGGDIGERINKANPLTVEAARAALAKAEKGGM